MFDNTANMSEGKYQFCCCCAPVPQVKHIPTRPEHRNGTLKSIANS